MSPKESFTNPSGHLYVQFGCGLCAPESWLNFDASPTLWLQKLPLVGNLVPAGPFGRFPLNVLYGDIVNGLPIAPDSVALLYCSHVLEHLTLEELRLGLTNCYRYLQPGGIFRMVLPDLEVLISQYLQSDLPEAAHEFMQISYLGKETRQRNLISFIKEWGSPLLCVITQAYRFMESLHSKSFTLLLRGLLTLMIPFSTQSREEPEWLSGSAHLWMYDYQSLSLELEKAGFRNIRRAQFGDSGIDQFKNVEDAERWVLELGIQCEKKS